MARVVNLKHRTDRWEQIQEDFKDAPFQLERYDAIQSKSGTRGLFYTHYKLITEAKERGDATILVLEDDAKPCKDYQRRWKLIKEYLDTHMEEWEVFNGGILETRQLFENPRSIVDAETPAVLFDAVRGGCNTFLYFNVNAMFEKMDKWEDYSGFECDVYYVEKAKTIACFPFLATQNDGFSDIEQRFRGLSDWFIKEEMFLKMVLNKYIKRCM